MNDPLTSGVLDNDDDNNNGTDIDVDFRSISVLGNLTLNKVVVNDEIVP